MQQNTEVKEVPNNKQHIYLGIDHLKNGSYVLNIILKNKIIKSIKFIK